MAIKPCNTKQVFNSAIFSSQMLLCSPVLSMDLELVTFGWMDSTVWEVKGHSLDALQTTSAPTTVPTLKT